MEAIYPVPQEASIPADNGVLLPATPADLSDITRVIQEASEFKYSRGDDLWGAEPFTDEEIIRMLDSGNLFVFRIGGEAAASVIVQDADERMWGEAQGNDGTALYVHKLSTGNTFRGQGVGGQVVASVEAKARLNGKSALRLDCPYDNEDLYGYYGRLGFNELRRYERPSSPGRRNPDKDVFRAALMEKTVNSSK